MDLDSLSSAISVGTLIAFNLVNSGVMIIRYSTLEKYAYVPTIFIAGFVLGCFLSALFFIRGFHWAYSVAFGVVALICFILLCVYHFRCKVQNIPVTFKCPLVPFVPCMGIAINSYMLAGLDGSAWIRLVVWLVIGLAIYFLYGIHMSKLQRNLKTTENSGSVNKN